ncbi:hypothetical protein WJX74_000370 [Apatococcus lobatus]|uniref:TLDc domain-containing protein n=1 Tax=Apatococcus lobatus TaxID=904363 RepID=A0AAW1SF02_9CHLO
MSSKKCSPDGQEAQLKDAKISEELLTPDQSMLLAQIAGQLAISTRAEKEEACQQVQKTCEELHSQTIAQLQHDHKQRMDELQEQHNSVMRDVKTSSMRREQDSDQFSYTIRGHTTADLSGSIPRNVFEAECNSVLNKIYNGEWAYAVDRDGRACINSDPAHWPIILSWLSFGTVPTNPSDAFVGECKYWQLENLLARIEEPRAAAEQSVTFNTTEHALTLAAAKEGKRRGFQLEGKLFRFPQRSSGGRTIDTRFEAFGASWNLSIKETGAYLHLTSGPSAPHCQGRISFGAGDDEEVLATFNRDFAPGLNGYGGHWSENIKLENLQRCPFVDVQGSLHVRVRVLFSEEKEDKEAPQCD